MDYETIRVTDNGGGVWTLGLHRPERRNAISIHMREEIIHCLAAWKADEAVGAVILTGEGPAFSAGFDLREFQQPEKYADLVRTSMQYHRDVWYFPKPIIAAVNGFALGGGFDLAAMCDIRLAAESAVFGHPEIKFGGAPLHTPLRWLVGEGMARDLCLTGRMIDAAEAHRIGLVSEVLPKDGLLARAGEFATMILEAPAEALARVKQAMIGNVGKDFEASMRVEHDEPFQRRYH